ncbi:MAG: hypothetical protein U0R64_08090 [Candidatus Nanopelagicales bacterium]
MDVRVDEPGEQQPSGQRQDLGVGAPPPLGMGVVDGDDGVTADRQRP